MSVGPGLREVGRRFAVEMGWASRWHFSFILLLTPCAVQVHGDWCQERTDRVQADGRGERLKGSQSPSSIRAALLRCEGLVVFPWTGFPWDRVV
jgi:hypothetical protein